MGQADVDAVARTMTLVSGYIWSMPIVFDLSQAELERLGVKPGEALLLTYQQQPLAVLEVEAITPTIRPYWRTRSMAPLTRPIRA